MQALTRRSLLRGVVGAIGTWGLSGCLIGGRFRRYRVSNDSVPDGLPATVNAEAVRTPTNEWPLGLVIRFESTADEPRTFTVEPPGAFPIGRATAENRPTQIGSDPQRLVLAGPGAGTLRDECWTAVHADGASSTPADPDRVRLAPGESVRVERAVLNHPANSACYPVGVYRFSVSFRSAPVEAPAREVPSLPWGFTLEIGGLRPDG